jgi:hypothetical protein
MKNTVSEDVLAPCPFCGGQLCRVTDSAEGDCWGHPHATPEVEWCPAGAFYVTDKQDDREFIIEAWNRRAYLAATKPPLADVTVKASDPHFYQLTDGSFAPYPHGMTEDDWNAQIGGPSYEHAKDLPSD